MKSDQTKFSRLLKSKVENAESLPPVDLWSSIEAELEQKKKRRAIFWIRSIAASVALLFVAWFAFNTLSVEEQNATAIVPIPGISTLSPTKKTKAGSRPAQETPSESGQTEQQTKTTRKGRQRPMSFGKDEVTNSPKKQLALQSEPEMEISRMVVQVEKLPGIELESDMEKADLTPEKVNLPKTEHSPTLSTPGRRVYGIGFGGYRIKASLASNE